jgi:hypothetical protein
MTDREPGAPDDALPADETNGDPFPDEVFLDDADVDEGSDDRAESAQDDEEEGAADEGDEGAPVWEPAARGSKAGSSGDVRRAGPAGPGVAERAVHLSDRASAIFVIGIVLTFVGILVYGMLAGSSGFLTPLPTPGPTPTEEPIPSDSLEPSSSLEPSVAPSASPATSPGASGSGAPSGSPSASPSSPKPSGSPSASPSASPSPSA